jgi:hypothetical protein
MPPRGSALAFDRPSRPTQTMRRALREVQNLHAAKAVARVVSRGTFREVLMSMAMTTTATATREHDRPAAIDQMPRGLRLGIVEELLGDLDTVTIGGQHFTMEKVVGLLRLEIGAVGSALGELQRRLVNRALEDLASEHGRPLPDAARFVARTHMITATLEVLS